jgi:hypothetical protein
MGVMFEFHIKATNKVHTHFAFYTNSGYNYLEIGSEGQSLSSCETHQPFRNKAIEEIR